MTASTRAGIRGLNQLRKLLVGERGQLIVRWGCLLTLVLGGVLGYPALYARHHARRAEAALANQDCAAALQHLEKCLSVWTESAEHHFRAARCSWREGHLEKADEHLQAAARWGWPTAETDREGLLVESQRAMTRSMEVSLGDLIQFAKDNKQKELEALALEAAILGFVCGERHSEATILARVLIDIQPDRWRAWWLLGKAQELQAPGRAAEAFIKSLELKADQPKVHRWMAINSARAGLANETLHHFRAAGPLEVTDTDAHLAAAKAYILLVEPAQARAILNQIWTGDLERAPWAVALRGLVELEENGPGEAAPWLTKADAMAPCHPEVIDALLVWAKREGNQKKTKSYQERKRRYKDAGDQIAAVGTKLDQLLRQVSANPTEIRATMYRLGMLLFETGQDDAALRCLESVLAGDPNYPGAHAALADYYQRVGDQGKATAHRAKAANGESP